MAYRFVSSFHDLGPRRGPILALTVHVAEGGGTVGFLHKQNNHGVSVHWVIEYDGDIVQMLREDHMHTSIRIRNVDGSSALRVGDDPDGFFGGTATRAVLGDWAYIKNSLGPNHATLAVELEGFAKAGPNAAQKKALGRLIADLRTSYPKLGLLGHRDHNVKTCPGKRIPWADYGGHAVATLMEEPKGDPMILSFSLLYDLSSGATIHHTPGGPSTGTTDKAHVVETVGTPYGKSAPDGDWRAIKWTTAAPDGRLAEKIVYVPSQFCTNGRPVVEPAVIEAARKEAVAAATPVIEAAEYKRVTSGTTIQFPPAP
jgi:hypothetical protein